VLEGSAILTAGEVGTEKTLFGFQFIRDGVKESEKSLIISLNEDLASITRNAKHFGFDFHAIANNGLVKVLFMLSICVQRYEQHCTRLQELSTNDYLTV